MLQSAGSLGALALTPATWDLLCVKTGCNYNFCLLCKTRFLAKCLFPDVTYPCEGGEVACRKCLGHGVCAEQDRGNTRFASLLPCSSKPGSQSELLD